MKKLILSITLSLAFLFNANAQIPNGFMENWVNTQLMGSGQEPQSWATTNVLSSPFLGSNPISVTKVSDSYQGFAAKITTIRQINNQTSGTIPDTTGFMILGTIDGSGNILPTPYSYPTRPNQLRFYSKYNPSGVDTAGIGILLYKWNTVMNKRDTIGEGYYKVGENQTSYALRTININYNVSMIVPDSMLIFVIASLRDTVTGQYPKVGSAIYVDHFYFDITAGIENENVSTSVNVYPNPSTFAVNFKFDEVQPKAILIHDLTGRLVENVSVNSSTLTLSTENWVKGFYTYSLIGNDNAVLKTGKFQVQ